MWDEVSFDVRFCVWCGGKNWRFEDQEADRREKWMTSAPPSAAALRHLHLVLLLLSHCVLQLCCLKWIKEGLQRFNLTDHEFLRPISCDDTGSSNENDNVTRARRRRRDV